jgi:hypothetical protein
MASLNNSRRTYAGALAAPFMKEELSSWGIPSKEMVTMFACSHPIGAKLTYQIESHACSLICDRTTSSESQPRTAFI